MTLSREKYNEIQSKYALTDSEVEQAFDFVHDVLAAEADIIERQEPYAINTIKRLNAAAYAVFEIGGDVFGDFFGS